MSVWKSRSKLPWDGHRERLLDRLLSRKASLVLALLLLAILALYARSGEASAGWPRTLLGLSATGLCAIYGLRLLARRRRWKRLPSPPAGPPLRWEDRERFDPISAGSERARGYTGYTDSFSATMTVHRYLAALPDEETRVTAGGFACAYLRERMGLPPSPVLAGESQPCPAREPAAKSILGWLAGIHRDYPDNAPADSTFVERALHESVTEYAGGRSLSLQQAWMSLATQTLVAGLSQDERQRQLDAQRLSADLDHAAIRRLLCWSAERGRKLGLDHGAIAGSAGSEPRA